MEEEKDNVEVLEIVDGTFVDNNMVVDSQIIPEFTDEEADDREYENILEDSEGGL